MILAYETATDICSVAFEAADGSVYEKRSEDRGVHSEKLFVFTQQLMREHDFSIKDIDRFLVSNGPGSYTGLRIAASAIKGLLFGQHKKIYAVNTLAGIAAGVNHLVQSDQGSDTHVVLNARRKHVYHQQFDLPEMRSDSGAAIIEIEELLTLLNEQSVIAGTGLYRFREELPRGCTVIGSEAISAVHLIGLMHHEGGEAYMELNTAESLKSDYITTSQVNNTGL